MNDRLALVRPLLRTRQCRHFTDEPVAEEDLQALLEVARWTGSSRNSQPWRFLFIRDVALIRALAEAGQPQTRSLNTATAAIAIVLPQDEERTTVHAYDDGRVAERILVAAGMLGLGAGICWVRSDVRQRFGEMLDLPDGHFVRTIMAIGHPSGEGRAAKSAAGQARLPLRELVLRQ
jgi:nitroreductase